MKRRLTALFMIGALALLLLAGCGRTEKKTVTIWHASDMHYLSPTLIEDRDAFVSLMEQGDGKATHYTPELCKAFADAAAEACPNAVIISGDLTLNGDLESHRELAELLTPLKEAGIRVLVLPGNHDLGGVGYRFTADSVEAVPAADPAAFAELYAEFGYNDAISRDEDSLSYVAELDGGVRVLMLDVNSGSHGSVTRDTMDWAEKQLKAARRQGCTVVAVSHQNLYRHSPLFAFGYELNNGAELAALYEKYGVKLNLSGHLHIQHIAQQGSTADIAVSSLAVTPNQYAVLRLDGDGMSYATQPLSVTVEENGAALSLTDYCAELFDTCTVTKTAPMLDGMDLTDAEYALMLETAKQMNREYFGGLVSAPDPEGYRLWTLQTEGFFPVYLESMYSELGTDHNQWSSG